MYANAAVKSAYATTSCSGGTPVNKEYAIIERVTTDLVRADRNKSENYSAFVDAITRNRKMWRLFGVDVAEPDNTLPKKLKAQIFYLSEFTDIHSREVLKGNETIEILVEINEMILLGLASEGTEP
ncbi:MAG: flagellar biosynthesis regulator FlaF [Pseudomonadota bacterium]